jgi:hypothetical protein
MHMKTTITAFCLAISMFGLGCGAPVEEGSPEDVAVQEEALLGAPGKCQILLKNGVLAETGICFAVVNGVCSGAASTACVAGKVAVQAGLACSRSMIDSTTCQ